MASGGPGDGGWVGRLVVTQRNRKTKTNRDAEIQKESNRDTERPRKKKNRHETERNQQIPYSRWKDPFALQVSDAITRKTR